MGSKIKILCLQICRGLIGASLILTITVAAIVLRIQLTQIWTSVPLPDWILTVLSIMIGISDVYLINKVIQRV